MTAKSFYAEEAQHDGSWAPVKYYYERPSKKKASGTTRRLRKVKEIDPAHYGLTLDQLQGIYGKDDENENEH